MKFIRIAALLLATALAAPAMAQNTNAEILLEKVKADKKLLIAKNMNLSEAEAKAFWPIYEAYQKDLDQINVRLGRAITAYAEAYKKGPLPNDVAMQLLDEALSIEEAETQLKRSYVPKLNAALPGAKTARYLQIENKIRALVRMELADNIPLVE
ncbi:MAG: hypothetical protein LJE97_10700 [Betaproteobacteria bacterium]|jgi:hypothetical protein|nr:hypothetical protein [Betaproteobacteria bacterium]